jgi:hypothetical protein
MTKLFLNILAFTMPILSMQAKSITSPNGQFSVQTDGNIQLVANGQPFLMIVQSTRGDTNIQVAWNSDSRKVVIVENTSRGSGVVAAFTEDGINWKKTLEMDKDASELIRQAQAKVGGRLLSERRNLAGWISPNEIQVTGELVFS